MRKGVVGMPELVSPRRPVEELARHTAMQHVFDSMSVGVGIAVEGGALIEVNDALLALLGVDRHRVLGATLDVLLGGDPVLSQDDTDRRERTFTRADGRRLWVRITVNDVVSRDGRILLKVHAVEDITDHKALERALRERALLDPVTGLPNRYLLEDRLEHALLRRDRGGQELAVLFVDLDGFKSVNDTAGHRAGDQVLREAGARIARCARAGDTVARWAGDEYVVLCDGLVDPQDAELVALRIKASCGEPFPVDGGQVSLGASVGVATTCASAAADADTLLDRADRAMYADKQARRLPVVPQRDQPST